MNIKTVDCTASAKEDIIRMVTELVNDGWIDPSVLERAVFSVQMTLGGLEGATLHVGSYMVGLEEAHRQGQIDQATLVETQNVLGDLDSDDYLVMINSWSCEETRKAMLVHEAVHVKQYMDKRLVNLAPGVISWEGQVLPAPTGSVDMEYFMSPWEQEAYDAQARYEAHTTDMSVVEVKELHLAALREHIARSQA